MRSFICLSAILLAYFAVEQVYCAPQNKSDIHDINIGNCNKLKSLPPKVLMWEHSAIPIKSKSFTLGKEVGTGGNGPLDYYGAGDYSPFADTVLRARWWPLKKYLVLQRFNAEKKIGRMTATYFVVTWLKAGSKGEDIKEYFVFHDVKDVSRETCTFRTPHGRNDFTVDSFFDDPATKW